MTEKTPQERFSDNDAYYKMPQFLKDVIEECENYSEEDWEDLVKALHPIAVACVIMGISRGEEWRKKERNDPTFLDDVNSPDNNAADTFLHAVYFLSETALSRLEKAVETNSD